MEGIQAADLYAYLWNRNLIGKINTPHLERAFQRLTKKKPTMFVADKTFFDAMLARRNQHRAEGIRRGLSEQS